jgi:EmrB/QacA subfamily drug resistance transporter
LSIFPSERRYRVYLTTLIGTFITVVDATASFVAVPTIALDLNVGLPVAQWVILGNMLAVTAVLVPIGRLSDSLGRKRLFVVGYAVLGLGALMASLASNMAVLIVGRIVMGLGAAMTQATSIPIVVSEFSAAERGRMLGGQMGAVGVGTVLGPVLGGAIVGLFGWRAIYWVTGAVALIVALLGARVLRRRAQHVAQSLKDFDVTGALLSIVFVVVLLVGLSNGSRLGWRDPSVLASLLASLVLATVLTWQERRARDPILDIKLFRLTDFSVGLISSLTAFSASASAYFLLPFYLQMVKGFSPEMLGLLLMPAGIVTALASPVMGYVADRVGHRRIATLGVAVNGLALIGLSFLAVDTPVVWTVVIFMFLSVGIASFHAPNSSAILGAVSEAAHGFASGFINLARNLGNVVGIAAGTAIVTGTMAARGLPPTLSAVADGRDPALLSAFVAGFSLATLTLGALCLLLALARLVRRV